jgi:hypothetical protein
MRVDLGVQLEGGALVGNVNDNSPGQAGVSKATLSFGFPTNCRKPSRPRLSESDYFSSSSRSA